VPDLRTSRDAHVRARILDALRAEPTAKAAAVALGISHPTLVYYMRKYGLRIETTRRIAA
jgi:transcriptional regulator with GAF, ATPase, and Fis domain